MTMETIFVELNLCQVTPVQLDVDDDRYLGAVAMALDVLSEQFQKNNLSFLSLTGKRRPREVDSIVSYRITGIVDKRHWQCISKLEYITSYYVGHTTIELPNDGITVEISIVPDLLPSVRNHLLEYACGVFLPKDLAGKPGRDRNGSHWLLLLMWRCAFEVALRSSSIPKSYIQKNENLQCFRGRLDVAKNIRMNLTNQSSFYCNYRPMSFDITINRVIRYVYKLIVNTAGIDKKTFTSLAEHDNRLAAFGVVNTPVLPEAIDRIKYTRMTENYRPLMVISKTLIRHFGASDYKCSSNALSYFVDWTEVWENYLLKVMQRYIPNYIFISPNDSSEKTWLLQCGREIRPDFLVYDKTGELVAVMDAKYKNYNQIGGSADYNSGSISREDLYQMTTYLYHYSTNNRRSLKGIFISRGETDKLDHSQFSRSALQGEIALLNLPLKSDNDSVEELGKCEESFAKRLLDYLEKPMTHG